MNFKANADIKKDYLINFIIISENKFKNLKILNNFQKKKKLLNK